MQSKIYEMRRLLVSLEQSILYLEADKFYKNINLMEQNLKLLKEQFESETNLKQDKYEVVKLHTKLLNTIEFIYKPVMVSNIFEGNYLEVFSDERTEELSKSRAINNHNEFWKQHSTVHGNIYGSVPIELINDDSVKMLEKFGWKRTNTNILEVKDKNVKNQEIIDYCDKFLDYYIIIIEESTKSKLILEYLID